MPELEANGDGHKDQKHEHERAVVLAWRTACIGITKLWQEEELPIVESPLQERSSLLSMVNDYVEKDG